MEKYILTSCNQDLRNEFNSEDFILANYFEDYTGDTIKSYLKLSCCPNVGDFLYFYNNYYKMIPVKVVRIVRNGNCNSTMIYCEPAKLYNIDSYIFSDKLSKLEDWQNVKSDFILDIIRAHSDLIKRIQKEITTHIKEYGEENTSRIGIAANQIIDYLGLDNKTIIDYTNLKYIICYILSKELEMCFDYNKWHRPSRFEYANM